ncbi:MAG: TetR/AcrR family transcriptional regulator [Anaerolineales bacterium]|nr:TetR/AcrR family transcriptional regulator [Anaerolineales bacterium]
MTIDQTAATPNEPSLSKGERTRKQIIGAALELFSDQGYHGTSMRQVADLAGIALGGIYNHFDNKEAIFTAVTLESHPIHTLLPALEAESGDTLEEAIHQSAERMYETLSQREDFLNLILIETLEFNGKHFPDIFAQIFPRAVSFSKRLTEKPGDLREDIPLPVMVATFIGMIFSFFLFQRLFGTQVDLGEPKSLLRQIMEIYLHGIQPQIGEGDRR